MYNFSTINMYQTHWSSASVYYSASSGKELFYLLSDLQDPSLKLLDEESKIGKDYGQAVWNAASTL